MATEHTDYERVSVGGNSRAHLGHSYSESQARHNRVRLSGSWAK